MGATIFGLLVTSTASEVRPWKAFSEDSTRVRPFWNEKPVSDSFRCLCTTVDEEQLIVVVTENLPSRSASFCCSVLITELL